MTPLKRLPQRGEVARLGHHRLYNAYFNEPASQPVPKHPSKRFDAWC